MTNPKSQIPNPKSLRPPQFGLRTLLLAVTACAVLAALHAWMSPMALAAIGLLVLAIIAHVSGNAIGTRLRELGSQPTADRSADFAPGASRAKPKAEDFAPATRLGQRHGLGWPLLVASVVGTIAGAIGGGTWTVLASPGPVGPLNIAVGVIAFAVLGGIASFATFGFVQVGVATVRQALAESKR